MSAPVLSARHLRWGWRMLLLFSALGLTLEMLHGFKLGLYLDVDNGTRRLMWRLAHAHGALLGLVNVALAASLASHPQMGQGPTPRTASHLLMAGNVLLPLGFFAGGFGHHGGDPGLGILLCPVGAVSLLGALACIVRCTRRIS